MTIASSLWVRLHRRKCRRTRSTSMAAAKHSAPEQWSSKENEILSGPSPALHWRAPSALPRSIRMSPQFPQKQQHHQADAAASSTVESAPKKSFMFFIASLCILCVTSCSSFESIYGAFHHNAIATFYHWQSKPQVCASHGRFFDASFRRPRDRV